MHRKETPNPWHPERWPWGPGHLAPSHPPTRTSMSLRTQVPVTKPCPEWVPVATSSSPQPHLGFRGLSISLPGLWDPSQVVELLLLRGLRWRWGHSWDPEHRPLRGTFLILKAPSSAPISCAACCPPLSCLSNVPRAAQTPATVSHVARINKSGECLIKNIITVKDTLP